MCVPVEALRDKLIINTPLSKHTKHAKILPGLNPDDALSRSIIRKFAATKAKIDRKKGRG